MKRWSYGRAWKALNVGDVIAYWHGKERPEHPDEGVVTRKMQPAVDREFELNGNFRIGEFSRIRWEKKYR